jgi:FKBP-type peptidyl-prolyl cis-trans isomerase FkpA
MIKKMMLLIAVAGTLLAGCNKNEDTRCTNVDPAVEEPAIIAYNASEGITATKHPTGIYYQIINLGTGVTPTQNSSVTVQYVGKLFNGTTFDSNTSPGGVQFPLSQLIPGWQVGIPLIRVGGKIRLIVPSAYAYGCNGSAPAIPSNSPLSFEISLLGVN